MSILVVGSIALDTINTQKASNKQLLGGSASHAAVAASFFSKVNLVGILGKDFPKRHLKLFNDRGINTEGLEIAPGKTFRWECQYEEDMNKRQTLSTDLGVFADFSPELPKTYIDTQYVLLANIAPALQLQVLDQVKKPRLVVADTMDLWLNTALPDLKKLLKKVDVFVLNDGEAMQLTGEDNVISAAKKTHKFGPKQVIVKKGEHGSILSGPDGLFIAPAFPLLKVVD
ncbi:MAG: sugar kinase, partial [Verrucomicrobia bacterium]|nr:sugar kinase [Verrucomicrobiota bacterium]